MKEVKCENCGKYTKGLYRHKIFCDSVQEFVKKYSFTKETLEKEYENLGSVLSFKDKYPDRSTEFYYKLFKYFDIKISIKRAANNSFVKNKREKTNLEKYGEKHNFSKNHISRISWEKRLLEEEGITNVFQRKSVKQKSLETIVQKYGSVSDVRKYRNSGKNISKLNLWFYSILEKNNIDYIQEFILPVDEEKRYYYSYDVFVSPNIIFEINGDYWHGNPKIYKPNDIILKGSSKEFLVKEKWEKDNEKIQRATDNGYLVFVIWEDEIKNNQSQVIEKVIKLCKK